LVFSSYLGGSNKDQGQGIAVDSADNAYVGGWTQSTDFPTKGPLQPAHAGGQDIFVTKITAADRPGVLHLPWGQRRRKLQRENRGRQRWNVYLTGVTTSTNFPTMNPFQPTHGGDWTPL